MNCLVWQNTLGILIIQGIIQHMLKDRKSGTALMIQALIKLQKTLLYQEKHIFYFTNKFEKQVKL